MAGKLLGPFRVVALASQSRAPHDLEASRVLVTRTPSCAAKKTQSQSDTYTLCRFSGTVQQSRLRFLVVAVQQAINLVVEYGETDGVIERPHGLFQVGAFDFLIGRREREKAGKQLRSAFNNVLYRDGSFVQ